MLERLPVRRQVRRLALLALAALALATMPGLPASAQQTTTQPLDDTQVDFAQGTLLRTAVNAGTVSGTPPPFADQDGTVELAAAGNLQQWTQPTVPELPAPLAYMGVTTIGTRLYTVAGATTPVGGSATFTDAVYWANLNQQTGALAPHGLTAPPAGGTFPNGSDTWVNDPLPQTAAHMVLAPNNDPFCNAEPIQSRRGPAVASFVTGSGTNYIYVVGGAFRRTLCGNNIVSSPAVQIGAVNAATGEITWSSAPSQANYLPSQNLPDFENWDAPSYAGINAEALGVEGAAAAIATTGTGTYLYVIGGLITWDDGATLRDLVTPAVYYTRLDPNTGALQRPTGGAGSPWVRTANVPLDDVVTAPAPAPGVLGLYNHAAVVSRAVVGEGTGTTIRNAIFVTGGYYEQPSVNPSPNARATVFRAIVNEDGTLTWATAFNPDPGVPGPIPLGAPRAGLAGFAFGNKLYFLGGTASAAAAPSPSGMLGAHDDSLNLLPLFGSGGGPVYFTSAENPVVQAADGLGAAVIPATPPPGTTQVANAAWGYAIGGRGADGAPTAAINRGPIGGTAETAATVRIPDGWYYSRFHNIRFESEQLEARILSIRWFTGIDRAANPNADLRLEFQRTKILPCNEAAFANSPWVPLDGSTTDAFSSVGGFNEVKLRDIFPTEDFNASCFRYRVFMTQNGSVGGVPNPAGNPNLSPRLFSINVEKVKPGDPDLQITEFNIGPDAGGRIATFDLKITNLNENVLNTIAITQERFPAVLCVAFSPTDPNVSLELPPQLPIAGDGDARVDCAPLYRWVDSSETIPGQIFSLAVGNVWQVNRPNVPHLPTGLSTDDPLDDAKAGFAVPGYYAVAVILDPFGLVPEGGQGKANNMGENLNNGQPLIRRFQITEAGFDRSVRLPMVMR